MDIWMVLTYTLYRDHLSRNGKEIRMVPSWRSKEAIQEKKAQGYKVEKINLSRQCTRPPRRQIQRQKSSLPQAA
jgi:quinol monooxygenase YgiN